MRSICILVLTYTLITISFISFAQSDSTIRVNLKESQDYALKNSPLTKNAQLDLESAKKKIWETTAFGLPQINAKLNATYMLTVPASIKSFSGLSNLGTWMYGADQALNQLAPGQGFGYYPNPGPPETVKESDMKWGSTLDITATQLIFSGSYIVGLQTAKTFRSLSEIALTKSEKDLKQSVSSAYYLVLVAEENKKVLDSTYFNTEKLKFKMEQMFVQGFIEETDVDQMKLTLSNLNDSRMMITRQVEIAYNLLKFQMGLDLSKKIELTDKIENFVDENNLQELLIKPFESSATPEVQLLESQERLTLLNVKYNQSTYLPDIAAFYAHNENFNTHSLSFTAPDMIGLSVNIPIFSSGMKHAKVQQARIALDKTRISKEQASQGLKLDHEKSKSELMSALDKYKTSKENMRLSDKIQKRTIIKYKEGMSSSTDITQVSNQYLQSMSNYFTSMMDLLNAKAKMEKLLNLN
ncbi:MAG: TolC family protein [Bacteroidia bacterium]|nr:TolC family protein [Bacteroidia bacterium]